jgi:hypothetical protein
MHKKVSKSLLEYTVEINPPTEASVKSYLYHDVPDLRGVISESKALMVATGGKKSSFSSSLSDEEFGLSMASMYKYSSRFDGLCSDVDYTVTLSTELDGKTITQTSHIVTKKSKKKSSHCNSAPPSSPK